MPASAERAGAGHVRWPSNEPLARRRLTSVSKAVLRVPRRPPCRGETAVTDEPPRQPAAGVPFRPQTGGHVGQAMVNLRRSCVRHRQLRANDCPRPRLWTPQDGLQPILNPANLEKSRVPKSEPRKRALRRESEKSADRPCPKSRAMPGHDRQGLAEDGSASGSRHLGRR